MNRVYLDSRSDSLRAAREVRLRRAPGQKSMALELRGAHGARGAGATLEGAVPFRTQNKPVELLSSSYLPIRTVPCACHSMP